MKYLMVFSLLMFSSFAYSEGLGRTVHIKKIFAEGSSTAGFYPKEALPECQWGIMYINLGNESGKAIFSMVLAAKATDSAVVRIDYTKDSSGKCLANGLHTE